VTVGSVLMTMAASGAVIVCGVLLVLASGADWRQASRVILSIAAAPWALAVVLLVGTSWRMLMRTLPPDIPRLRADMLPEPMGNTEAARLRIEVGREQADGSHTISVMHLDGIRGDQLVAFAHQVSRGASLAVAQWTGAGSPFTRPQYDRLMSELRTAGLVTAGAGNQPRQLTTAGRGVMRRVASGQYEMD
jgi:hypothetical protein